MSAAYVALLSVAAWASAHAMRERAAAGGALPPDGAAQASAAPGDHGAPLAAVGAAGLHEGDVGVVPMPGSASGCVGCQAVGASLLQGAVAAAALSNATARVPRLAGLALLAPLLLPSGAFLPAWRSPGRGGQRRATALSLLSDANLQRQLRRLDKDTAQGLVQSEDPLWQRPLENVRKVGQGSSGIVWKARVPGTLEDIAVKTIPLTSRRQHSFAVSELAHLDQYSGGDVVSLFDAAIANMYEDGVFLSSEQPVLLLYMEAAAGSLYEVVLGSSGFEHIALSTRLRLLVEILRGMRKLERGGCVHRDIKPENVLVFGDPSDPETLHAKLGDFGVACDLEDCEKGKRGMLGSPPYMAPEVWRGRGHRLNSDVWSAGILAFELFVGRLPVALDPTNWDIPDCRAQMWRHPFRRFVPSPSFDITSDPGFLLLRNEDPQLAALLRQMLRKRVWRRPSIHQVLSRVTKLARSRGVEVSEQPASVLRQVSPREAA